MKEKFLTVDERIRFIGKELMRYRKRARESVNAVSRQTTISSITIHYIEKGERLSSPLIIKTLMNAYRTTVEEQRELESYYLKTKDMKTKDQREMRAKI